MLVQALRGPDEVAPAGVVRIERLLTDGAGPLYLEAEHGALRRAVLGAAQALYDMPAA